MSDSRVDELVFREVLATFPAFAKEALGVTSTVLLQGMLATTGAVRTTWPASCQADCGKDGEQWPAD